MYRDGVRYNNYWRKVNNYTNCWLPFIFLEWESVGGVRLPKSTKCMRFNMAIQDSSNLLRKRRWPECIPQVAPLNILLGHNVWDANPIACDLLWWTLPLMRGDDA